GAADRLDAAAAAAILGLIVLGSRFDIVDDLLDRRRRFAAARRGGFFQFGGVSQRPAPGCRRGVSALLFGWKAHLKDGNGGTHRHETVSSLPVPTPVGPRPSRSYFISAKIILQYEMYVDGRFADS